MVNPTVNFTQNGFEINGVYARPKDAALWARSGAATSKIAIEELSKILNIEYKNQGAFEFPSFVEPHQREGVIHALTRSRSYLAHAPGAGKTLQTILIALMSRRRAGTTNDALIVCPPNLVENWIREIRQWTNQLQPGKKFSISVVRSGAQNTCFFDHRANFILCPDSLIARPEVQFKIKQLRPIVTASDEASRMKGPVSQRCTAFLFSGLQALCSHFFLLDGSPLTLGAIDLWAPTFACDPEAIDFMTLDEFEDEYTVRQVSHGRVKYLGSKNMDILREKLLKRFMHQVEESELFHTERVREIHLVGQTNFVTESFGEQGLRELGHMPQLDTVDCETLAEYRRQVGVEMIPHAMEFVGDRLRAGEKVLLFAYHRTVCEYLAKAFSTVPLYGGTNALEREKVLADFKASKRPCAIVGQVDSMGRGHNIQEANRVVFAEYSWSDEVNKQAEKRVSRMGNGNFLLPCDYLALKDSVAERILRSVLRKSRDFNSLFGIQSS